MSAKGHQPNFASHLGMSGRCPKAVASGTKVDYRLRPLAAFGAKRRGESIPSINTDTFGAGHFYVSVQPSAGKPTDNAFIESFNGTFRNECLNAHWFESLKDAKMQIAAWQQEYNESRPHRALGEVPPAEFARRHWLKRESTIENRADD